MFQTGGGGAILSEGTGQPGTTVAEQMAASEKLLSEANESLDDKMRRTQEIQKEREKALEEMGVAIKTGDKGTIGLSSPQKLPHLINLNEDPLMSECLLYYIKDGITRVGTHDAEVPQDVQLSGEGVLDQHCQFENLSGAVTITAFEGDIANIPVAQLKSKHK